MLKKFTSKLTATDTIVMVAVVVLYLAVLEGLGYGPAALAARFRQATQNAGV